MIQYFTLSEVIEKRCSICGVTKPIDGFSLHRGAKDGLSERCRACRSEMRRAADYVEYWVIAHRKEVNAA